MKFLGVEYAPLNVPRERRLQTLAATGYFLCLTIFGPLWTILFAYVLLCTNFFWLPLIYFTFWYSEVGIETRGARASSWVRGWAWWRYYRDFFPAKLHKTAELDPSKNYVFAIFPHGLFCSGGSLAFATDALEVNRILPGIKPSMVTLAWNFKMPVIRDLLLSSGTCLASKESLNYLLSDPKGGRAAVLVVGGAAESLKCRPGTYNIVLKNRKGFVKLALKNGASLVPVFSFGENELYDQWANPEGSWLRWLQETVRKYTGVAPIVIIGRGLFQYTYGLLPRRRPLNVVVGKPINVKKVEEPTQGQIDEAHGKFIDTLVQLFEEEKHKYLENSQNINLVIS